jgi:hypothetical protein
VRQPDFWHIPRHRFLVGLCLELRLVNSPPTRDCTAAMGYCMTTHHDTGVIMSPQPSQDGRWATFVPASYKNMALGEAQLAGTRTGGEVGLGSFYSPGSESRCWRAWRGCGLRGREPNQHTAFPGGEPTRRQSPSPLRWQLGSRWVAVLASLRGEWERVPVVFVGLAPRPQALPMPAAALILYLGCGCGKLRCAAAL